MQPQLYSNEYFFCITALPTEQLEIIRIADYMHFLEFGGIFESTINRSFIDRTVWPYFTAILIFGGHILPLRGNPPIKFIQYDIR